MKPAYHIHLTASEKRLITELAAIQSQIEWLMQATVQVLLGITMETARLMMGSTNLSINSNIWRQIVAEKHPQKDEVLPWADFVLGEMASMAKGRNDFLHTLYGTQDQPSNDPDTIAFSFGHHGARYDGSTRTGIRVKNAAVVPLDSLRELRDRAAYLSIATAHVEWTAADPLAEGGSPWLRRLGARHPPQPAKAKPPQAKAQQRPRQS